MKVGKPSLAEVDARVLRVTDPETARVVAVHRYSHEIVGAGCLIDGTHILTCRHVVAAAMKGGAAKPNQRILVSLAGVLGQPTVWARVVKVGEDGPENDVALLEIVDEPPLPITEVEFASPLRHGGKSYSALGFPGGDAQGRNARGHLHSADAKGLVQMDRGGALSVLGGFSGAPVWSPDLGAFIGLVVTEQAGDGVSWCIPSRRLCDFYHDLLVRFRVPVSDRPRIHDLSEDDPNLQMFGTRDSNGTRKLSVHVRKNDEDTGDEFKATATYRCLDGCPRGGYVTFITHPSFTRKREDAYELFVRLDAGGCAKGIFFPDASFVVAAIGDAGDTALTFDLKNVKTKPKRFS